MRRSLIPARNVKKDKADLDPWGGFLNLTLSLQGMRAAVETLAAENTAGPEAEPAFTCF